MTLKELQQIIENNEEPIRIQGLLKKRTETIREFLVLFFTKWNGHDWWDDDEEESGTEGKDTIYVSNKEIQTNRGCRRSLGDVYLICKYYYPNTTLKRVRDLMCEELFEDIPRFRTSMCHTIDKRVWYQGSPDEKTGVFDKEEECEEFRLDWEDLKKLK